jgi:atypical dual specificity phosphatase
VAIDSGVPRRPPAGKRLSDISQYPKLVELLLNSSQLAIDLLHEISWEKLGCHISETTVKSMDQFVSRDIDQGKVVHEFQASFRGGLREMQRLQPFILKLHYKLDVLMKTFLSLISKYLPGDDEKEDVGATESSHLYSSFHNLSCQSPVAGKECLKNGQSLEPQDLAYTSGTDSQDLLGNPFSKSSYKDNLEMSPFFQDNCHGKYPKGNGGSFHSMHMIVKLKDLNKIARFDSELSKALEHWNEMLGMEVIKLCHEMNFITGFFLKEVIHKMS